MTERDRLIATLRALALPRGQWVLSGSGVMVLHGLKRSRPMGDVDIFVTTRLWFDLYADPDWRLWTTDPADEDRWTDPPYLVNWSNGFEVNAFFQWRRRPVGNIDTNALLRGAEEVAGWPCVPLVVLRDWKRELGRDKDQEDVYLIDSAL